MRLLLGIILGVALTVGGARLYDSSHTSNVDTAQSAERRPLVNWDVVNTKLNDLTRLARVEWDRLRASTPAT